MDLAQIRSELDAYLRDRGVKKGKSHVSPLQIAADGLLATEANSHGALAGFAAIATRHGYRDASIVSEISSGWIGWIAHR